LATLLVEPAFHAADSGRGMARSIKTDTRAERYRAIARVVWREALEIEGGG